MKITKVGYTFTSHFENFLFSFFFGEVKYAFAE